VWLQAQKVSPVCSHTGCKLPTREDREDRDVFSHCLSRFPSHTAFGVAAQGLRPGLCHSDQGSSRPAGLVAPGSLQFPRRPFQSLCPFPEEGMSRPTKMSELHGRRFPNLCIQESPRFLLEKN
jgi:hypothetical protein